MSQELLFGWMNPLTKPALECKTDPPPLPTHARPLEQWKIIGMFSNAAPFYQIPWQLFVGCGH